MLLKGLYVLDRIILNLKKGIPRITLGIPSTLFSNHQRIDYFFNRNGTVETITFF